jgi:hypothetical protein
MTFICEINVFNKQTKEWNDNLKYIKIIVMIRGNRNHVKQEIIFILYIIILELIICIQVLFSCDCMLGSLHLHVLISMQSVPITTML